MPYYTLKFVIFSIGQTCRQRSEMQYDVIYFLYSGEAFTEFSLVTSGLITMVDEENLHSL